MAIAKAYEEVIDFIAAGSSPRAVLDFRPSDEARARVADLLAREKTGSLSAEEASELEHYLQLEHVMRLAKARARQYLPETDVPST
ncbi:hypothetical protein BH24GEM3_BH24GEM3_22130 [soil metagenome]|jgi:hypothetical protein